MHPTQQKIFELACARKLQRPQSLRDIGKMFNELHPQKIKHHLQQLERRGLITVDWKSYIVKPHPALHGPEKSESFISYPILGSANCGEATLYAEEHPEGMLKISKGFGNPRRKLFALRAVGNSMNNAEVGDNKKNIEDGDFVLIDPSDKNIKDGDYVLSIIDGAANIKMLKIDKQHNQIVLVSKSTDRYPPIVIHETDSPNYFVNGKVVSVVKTPKY